MGYTKPILKYLTHSATLRSISSTWVKDSYWVPVKVENDTVLKCFIDFPKKDKKDWIWNESIDWDIRLFTESTVPVKIWDLFVDLSWLTGQVFVILWYDPVLDDKWVHHLEILLKKHG